MLLPQRAISDFSRRLWAWRWAWAALLGIVLIYRAARLLTRGRGDLHNHLTFGQRFLERQFIYDRGLDIVYPPFWAMAHAPFALLPRPLGIGLIFLIGVGLGAVLMLILQRLGRRPWPLSPPLELAALLIALALASRFILNDLSIGNPNTSLVALTWLGICLWSRGRDWLGGAALGLAVALKCTAGLFILYFLWKRQWKMAASSLLLALALSLAPILWAGPQTYAHQMKFWLTGLVEAARQPDPSIGILGQERAQNNALKASLARYLMRLPPGHLGRPDHPLYFDVLTLPPRAASLVIAAASALLVIIPAWLFRRPIAQRDGPDVLLECAAVGLLMLLLSPVTWSAHLVWMIPGFYLAARLALFSGQLPGWILLAAGAYVLVVVVLNRSFIGREASLVLDSYHLQMWVMLLLLVVLLALHRAWVDGFAVKDIPQDQE